MVRNEKKEIRISIDYRRRKERRLKKENKYMQEDSYKGGTMVEKKWTTRPMGGV